jgi:hypothetical protein
MIFIQLRTRGWGQRCGFVEWCRPLVCGALCRESSQGHAGSGRGSASAPGSAESGDIFFICAIREISGSHTYGQRMHGLPACVFYLGCRTLSGHAPGAILPTVGQYAKVCVP